MPTADEPVPPHPLPEENHRHGRLTVRAGPVETPSTRTGLITMDEPLALVYVPEPVTDGPYRLVLLLHGAGGAPRRTLDLLLPVADAGRLLLVAPKSATTTWDLIRTGLGPDVRRIDRVLAGLVADYPVSGMVIGGFSDGASYALSLGLINGDVFTEVLAFSPGFAAPLVTHGQPRVFVSHGTADRVLPVDRCSRRLVPRLRALRYDVTYHEFDGGHEVPGPVVERAIGWLDSGGG